VAETGGASRADEGKSPIRSPIVTFLFMQRYWQGGLTAGDVKG
jgi:hypothetical protein